MDAEFEEKEYEAPLYNQLLFGSHHVATPGQVFEGKFGIDAALQALNPYFWDLFGYAIAPLGVRLCDFQWGYVWRKYGKTRPLPNFSLNLLIQSKRPTVLLRARGAISSYGIRGPFWRFYTRQHQQEILERISRTLNRKALVVYASPAFDTLDLLYEHTQKQTIVENSTFVKVEKMAGHHEWNYDKPGTRGLAQSEPEFIEDRPFKELLVSLSEYYNPQSNLEENLMYLHKITFSTCQELSSSNPLARHVVKINERLTAIFRQSQLENIAVASFVNLTATFSTLGVSWLTVGGSEPVG